MTVKVLYTASATANGGRDGRSKTADGALDVKLAKPKEMGGNGDGNNPEQLLAVAYAACFLGAVKAVAEKNSSKVPQDATVTAHVGVGPREEGGFGFEISLDVALPGMNNDEAQSLVELAHQTCPFSNAMRNNVDVKLNVV